MRTRIHGLNYITFAYLINECKTHTPTHICFKEMKLIRKCQIPQILSLVYQDTANKPQASGMPPSDTGRIYSKIDEKSCYICSIHYYYSEGITELYG